MLDMCVGPLNTIDFFYSNLILIITENGSCVVYVLCVSIAKVIFIFILFSFVRSFLSVL